MQFIPGHRGVSGNEAADSAAKVVHLLLYCTLTPYSKEETCDSGVEETIEYLFLECSKYKHQQESLMGVACKQYGENEWNTECVEENSSMSYLVGLNEKSNMIVVDAMKNFLVQAQDKRLTLNSQFPGL
ncbi:Ribonuclease H domain [Trinorchestia longiramus]|nr:Ribonuclease H domain [Trinorchestia longiramus]